ncbi:MAG TPA: putative toxin-antitoxin system toxin component, PIN family [Acidisarcina sp.]
MTHVPRVVLDTNILVSAALRPGSVPYQAVTRALSRHQICISVDTLAELDQVLKRAKFDRYMDAEARLEFIALIVEKAQVFAVQRTGETAAEIQELSACRDPQDRKFLALALACDADAIISGDTDLLVLHPWLGISILTPAEFLNR